MPTHPGELCHPLFVGGFIHITLHVYVHALHFLFPAALCEALQLIYFGVTEVLVSSGAVTDTRTVSLDCGNGRHFCVNAHDVWYVQGGTVLRQTALASR